MKMYIQEQRHALQFQGKKVNGFDVNQLPIGSILPQPLTTLNEMEPTTCENNQSLQITGGIENMACEGEDESFHAGNHNSFTTLHQLQKLSLSFLHINCKTLTNNVVKWYCRI